MNSKTPPFPDGQGIPRTGEDPAPGSPGAAILEAARRLFAEAGFAATSTRKIAEAAGVNLAMIHYYFRNKDQLYRRVVELELADFFNLVGGVVRETPAPADFLPAMPAFLLDLHLRHPYLRQILLREMIDGAPRLKTLVQDMGADGPLGLRLSLAEMVQDAEGEGGGRSIPADHLLALTLAMCHGLMAFAPLITEVFGLDLKDPATARALSDSAGEVVRKALAPLKEA